MIIRDKNEFKKKMSDEINRFIKGDNGLEILIRSKNPLITIPKYETKGSAGLDLQTDIDVFLLPGQRKTVDTGISVAIPKHTVCDVRPRSGLAHKMGISIVNSPGTVDEDYRGPLKVILINTGDESVQFQSGDRIAQMVILPYIKAKPFKVNFLKKTIRGIRGFGSSGIK